MVCYISELNTSQSEKNRLQSLHEEIWEKASKVVSKAKTPSGELKLVLPKNDVGKAISGLAAINKQYGTPVVGRGGNVVVMDKGKQVQRELIKVDVSGLKQSNSGLQIQSGRLGFSSGKYGFIPSETWTTPISAQDRLPSPLDFSTNTVTREMAREYSEGVARYLSSQILHSDKWYAKAFRELHSKYPNIQLGTTDNELVGSTAFQLGNSIVFNLSKLHNFKWNEELVDSLLSEEVIHLVHENILSAEDNKKIYSELTPNDIANVNNFYGLGESVNLTEDQIVKEYLRMQVQTILYGTQSEYENLKQKGLASSVIDSILNLFSTLKKWLSDKQTPLVKELSNRIIDFENYDKYTPKNSSELPANSNLGNFRSKLTPDKQKALKESSNYSVKNANVDDVFKGRSVVDAKTLLNEISQSSHPLAKLAGKLSENLNRKVPVYLRDNIIGGGRGEYYGQDDTIAISRNEVNPKGVESTILHETIHAITTDKLYDENNKEVLERFTKLYNVVRTKYPDHYNTQNLDEFITGIFTNSEFINKLKNLDPIDVNHTSLWEDILNTIMSLFGIKKGTTLYEQAFNVGSEIIQGGSKKDEGVKYTFRAISILQSKKGKEVFDKGNKNKWSLEKILTELAIPKEQKALLLELGATDRDQLALELGSKYGFSVEVNVTKEPRDLSENPDGTKYYSNLTVPGGTNYQENEISTPLITPSIKGHAQFATDNGIGWFRSDDKSEGSSFEGGPEDWTEGESTKTRRILEVQSDLFQKGRDKKDLIGGTTGKLNAQQQDEFQVGNFLYFIDEGGDYVKNDLSNPNMSTKFEKISKEEFDKNVPVSQTTSSENQFLQLLNKDANWVTFFVKSIIQDSLKQGYEKVVFPSGDTASKIEGHETLEGFKREKTRRLEQLEQEKEIKENYEFDGDMFHVVKNAGWGQTDEFVNADGVFYKNGQITSEKEFNDAVKVHEQYVRKEGVAKLNTEIEQLKKEIDDVETGGFAALKPIYNFYENTVQNILSKQFGKPERITDEHGNKWFEIDLADEKVKEQSQNILFEKTPLGQYRDRLSPDKQQTLDYFLDYLTEANPNFKVEFVKDLGENGIVDFTTSIIRISETASLEDVTEEILHVLFEMSSTEDQNELMKAVLDTDVYGKTFEQYKDDPEYQLDGKPNVAKIKREAAVKLINNVANQLPVQVYGKSRVLDIVKKLIDKLVKLFTTTDSYRAQEIIYRIITKEQVFVQKDLTNLGKFKSKTIEIHDTGIYGMTVNDKEIAMDLDKLHTITIPVEAFFNANGRPNTFHFQMTELVANLQEANSTAIGRIRILAKENMTSEEQTVLAPFEHLGLVRNWAIGIAPDDYFVHPQFTNFEDGRVFNFGGRLAKYHHYYIPAGLDFNAQSIYTTRIEWMKAVGVKDVIEFEDGTIESISVITPNDNLSTSKGNRLKVIERDLDPVSEFIEKYADKLDDEQKKLLLKSIDRIKRNTAQVKDMPFDLSKNLISKLSRIKNETDMINSLQTFFDYIHSMELSIDSIKTHLDGDVDVDQLMTYTYLLGGWAEILKETTAIVVKVSEADGKESRLLPTLRKLSGTIGSLEDTAVRGIGAVTLLGKVEEVLIDKKAEQLYNELIKPYYDNQIFLTNKLRDELVAKGTDPAIIKVRLDELKIDLDSKNEISLETCKDYFRGKLGDIKESVTGGKNKSLAAVNKTLVSFFDKHLLGVSLSNDPIIASMGLWHRNMIQLSNVALEPILDTKNNLNPLIKQLGGHFKVGEALTTIQDTYIPKDVWVDSFLGKIKMTQWEKSKDKFFANKYGDWMNFEHQLHIPVDKEFKIGEQVMFKIDRFSLNEIKSALNNLKNLREKGFVTEDEIKEYRDNLEINYNLISEDFLKGYYTDSYRNAERSTKDQIRNKFGKSRAELEKIIKFQREFEAALYRDIDTLNTQIKLLDPFKDRETIFNRRLLIADKKKMLYEKPQEYIDPSDATNETIYKEWKELWSINKEPFTRKDIDYNTLLLNVKRFEPSFTRSITSMLNPFLTKDSLTSDEGEAFVDMLVEIHASSQYRTQLQYGEEGSEFITFLNNTLSYSGNEEWNKLRKEQFDTIADANVVLNGEEFLSYENGSLVNGEFPQVFTADDIALQTYVDNQMAIAALNGTEAFPVVNSVSEIQSGYYFVEQYYSVYQVAAGTKPKQVFKTIRTLAKDGRYVKVGQKAAEIGDLWTEIQDLVYPFKDRNGSITPLPSDVQKLVKEKEQKIEDLKKKPASKFFKISKESGERRKADKKKAIQTLDDLQQDYTTETYYDELRLLLEKNKGSRYFSELIGFINNSKSFGTKVATVVNQLDAITKTFENTPEFLENNPQYTQEDLNIAQWIMDNHIQTEREVKAIYPYRKYLPKEIEYFRKDLSSDFQKRVVKDEYIADDKFVDGNYLPKEGIDDESTRKFNNLTPELQTIHAAWVEDIHIKNQKEAQSKWRVKDSIIGYRNPRMAKKYVELSPLGYLKRKFNDLTGVNLFESGEVGVENNDEDYNKLKSWWERKKDAFMNMLNMTRNTELGDLDLWKDKTNKLPVNYTGRMDADEITNDVFHSVMEYQRSLTRQSIIHDNFNEAEATIKLLETNKGQPDRLLRLQKFMQQVVFKEGIGGTSFPEKVLLVLRKVITMGSQTITNPAGNVKNYISSNIANHLRTLNVSGKWRDRQATHFINFYKSHQWAAKVARQRNVISKETPFELFIFQRFLPGENFPAEYRKKDFVLSGDVWFGGNSAAEFQVRTNLFLNITSLYAFKDGEKDVKFMDIWEKDGTRWKIKDTVTDLEGNPVNGNKLELEVQSLMNQQAFSSTGFQGDDVGVSLNNPAARTALMFMRFMSPLILESLTNNRRDFIQNRQVQNFNVAIIKTVYREFQYAWKYKSNYWHFMSDSEKTDFLRGAHVYLWGFMLLQILTYLFGFDADDDDKFDKLEDNSYFTNLMLISTMKTISEIESQSLVPFQGKNYIPVVSENWQFISNNMAFRTIDKLSQAVEGGEFKRDDEERGIEKGDSKRVAKLKNVLGLNFTEKFNMPYQIKLFYKFNIEAKEKEDKK